MARDPVCKMNVDEKKLGLRASIRERHIISNVRFQFLANLIHTPFWVHFSSSLYLG